MVLFWGASSFFYYLETTTSNLYFAELTVICGLCYLTKNYE